MPFAPPRPCSAPGCPAAAVYRRRCPAHSTEREQERGSAGKRGYDATWRRLRKLKLARNPLCEECLKTGRIESAREVHHQRTIRERPDLRLELGNLTSLCKPCHSRITAQENGWAA